MSLLDAAAWLCLIASLAIPDPDGRPVMLAASLVLFIASVGRGAR